MTINWSFIMGLMWGVIGGLLITDVTEWLARRRFAARHKDRLIP